jgi:amidohydrolase
VDDTAEVGQAGHISTSGPHSATIAASAGVSELMDVKRVAQDQITEHRERLIALSHRIHAHPEIGWEEEQASTWLAELLDANGFTVERGACGLPTAFVARAGSGPLHIAICAEYDALPEIGHACGHNIIATAAAGAGIAAAKLADELGLTVSVIGTPAEELLDVTSGGKILLLERGAFAGVHAAMMIHPGPANVLEPGLIAAAMFDVRYTGRTAHAGAFPHLGINAADALVVAQTAIGLLRQQLRPTDRVHGIVTRGGDAANVIPASTSASYGVRASRLEDLIDVRDKVQKCFEAGALATGATLSLSGGERPYAEGRWDPELSALFERNAGVLGRTFRNEPTSASTDMGNISHAMPTIHPMLGIDCLPAVNHQPEFTAHTVTEAGDRAIVDGATAMAWTIADIATTASVRERLLTRSSG